MEQKKFEELLPLLSSVVSTNPSLTEGHVETYDEFKTSIVNAANDIESDKTAIISWISATKIIQLSDTDEDILEDIHKNLSAQIIKCHPKLKKLIKEEGGEIIFDRYVRKIEDLLIKAILLAFKKRGRHKYNRKRFSIEELEDFIEIYGCACVLEIEVIQLLYDDSTDKEILIDKFCEKAIALKQIDALEIIYPCM